MWFWQIYLGLAVVGLVLSLLGWSGSRLLRPVPRSSDGGRQAIRARPRHRRDLETHSPVTQSWARLGLRIRRTLRLAPRERRAETRMPTAPVDSGGVPRVQPAPVAGDAGAVDTARAGPVRSGLLRCSTFAASLGNALIVSSTCVVVFVLSIDALYWGGERLFGPDWVEFLDGLLG
jgi:hypothetical protein